MLTHPAEVMAMSTDTAEPTSQAKPDIPHEVVVKCPATGQLVGSVPVATSVEVEAVADRLRAASRAGDRWVSTAAHDGWASGATG
jgi:acyl-CoA reductase-like NAD-dependent aldehyde dehydrogenase